MYLCSLKLSLSCILVLAIYGSVVKRDPLLTKLGVWDLTGWSLTHVLFYSLLGYRCPDNFKLIMAFGVVWEIVEHLLSRFGVWWYGRVSDIVMNAIGFGLGAFIKCL